VSTTPISNTDREGDSPVEVAGGFPRHLTRELLEEDTQREERRRWLAPWFLGGAYTLFALRFPVERVIGNFPVKAEAGESLWWRLLETGGGESLGFLLSALAAGLFLPLMIHALVATGLPRTPSLVAAICVGFSPLMIHAATLPGPEAAVGLASLAALWFAAPHEAGRARTSAAIAMGVVAAILDPGGVLILPALLIRHFSRSGARSSAPMYGWYGFAWGVVAVVALEIYWLLMFPETLSNPDSAVLRYAIFPGVLGLGLALLMTGRLFHNQKDGLAEDTPSWLRIWVVGGVASLLFPGASGLCLAPVAAFAIADFLARGAQTTHRAAALILTGQLLLTLGGVLYVRTHDPHHAWRIEFQETVQEGDHLISHDPAHRYLARIRWGFKAFRGSDPLGKLSPPYVLDSESPPPLLQRVGESSED